jgi:hypothetical protein
MDRKEFVLKHKDYKYFGIVMKSNFYNVENNLKNYFLKITHKLSKAKEFINFIK